MMRFLPWCLLLFPALELWVLIQVGEQVGALATVALVILSTMAGLFLLRLRGARVASRLQSELSAGRLPSAAIMDTMCMAAAGWLFIFPGFVSDIIALLLLFPPTRALLAALIVARLQRGGFHGTVHTQRMYTDSEGRVHWSSETHHSPSSSEGEDDAVQGRPRQQVVIDCEPGPTTLKEDSAQTDPESPALGDKPKHGH